jgi:hypothetical protein
MSMIIRHSFYGRLINPSTGVFFTTLSLKKDFHQLIFLDTRLEYQG